MNTEPLTLADPQAVIASISLQGELFELAGLRGNEPPAMEELGAWARLFATAVGEEEAASMAATIADWLSKHYHLGRTKASATNDFDGGRLVGHAESVTDAMRQKWVLALLAAATRCRPNPTEYGMGW